MKSFRDALRHRRFRGLAGAGSEVGIIGTKKEATKRMPLFLAKGTYIDTMNHFRVRVIHFQK